MGLCPSIRGNRSWIVARLIANCRIKTVSNCGATAPFRDGMLRCWATVFEWLDTLSPIDYILLDDRGAPDDRVLGLAASPEGCQCRRASRRPHPAHGAGKSG